MQIFKKIVAVILTASLCLLLTACAGNDKTAADNKDETPSGPVKVGDTYRDFTGALTDSSSFKLSDHEGKVILLNFWATWCGPCVGEMPAFPKLVEKYGDDLVLVAVNCGENKKTVKDFLDSNDYSFNAVLDPDYAISDLYPTDGIPYTLIIGRDGKIAEIELGASGADAMFDLYSEYIDAALQN